MIGDNGFTDVFDESKEATDYATYEAYKAFVDDLGMDHIEAMSLLKIHQSKLDQLKAQFEPPLTDE